MGDRLNAATKFVVDPTVRTSLEWGPFEGLGTRPRRSVFARLKSQDGPDLVIWGSTTLTSVLLDQGLVDEVVLIVYPVLLGQGKRFFADNSAPRELALVSTKASPTGGLINTYRHVGSLAAKSSQRPQ